jgi:hypothetical protein
MSHRGSKTMFVRFTITAAPAGPPRDRHSNGKEYEFDAAPSSPFGTTVNIT